MASLQRLVESGAEILREREVKGEGEESNKEKEERIEKFV